MNCFKKLILCTFSIYFLLSCGFICNKSIAIQPNSLDDTFFVSLRKGNPSEVSVQYKNPSGEISIICAKFVVKEYPKGNEKSWFNKMCFSNVCFFEEGETSTEVKPGEIININIGIFPTEEAKINELAKIVLEIYPKKEPIHKTFVTIFAICISPKTIEINLGEKVASINGNTVTFDSPPFIVSGRTFVPLRFIAENLGTDVKWDPKTQKVSFISFVLEVNFWIGRKDVQTKIGSHYSKTVSIDEPPVLVSNRTFVPLRVVSENLGAQVLYDENNRNITIHYPPLPKYGN